MQTPAKRWMRLAAGAVAAGAALGWMAVPASEGQEQPSAGLAAMSERHVAALPSGDDSLEKTTRAALPAVAASAAHRAPAPGSLGPASSALEATEGPAAHAQLVQAALAGNEPGLATRAAVVIGRCLAMEGPTGFSQFLATAHSEGRLSTEVLLGMQAWVDLEMRMCQALDAHSRAQWLPLLRRGLAEGRVGDASDLLGAFTLSPFRQQMELEVFPYLRRDALRCHESSLSALYLWPKQSDQQLTVDEAVAVWQVLKSQYAAKPDEPWPTLARLMAPPRQTGNDAEVQRIAKAIRSHC